jgi:putative spermidine/putrescine transport system permease protein
LLVTIEPWFALAPAIAIFLPGFLWPMVVTLRNSFWRDVVGKLPEPAFTFENYVRILSDPFYAKVFLNTALVATGVTLCCLVIGYPFAMFLTFVAKRSRTLLIWAVYLPLFISVIVRALGWMAITADSGLINSALLKLGLIEQPLHMLYELFAMTLGMVHRYLPLMVLPLAGAMMKIDISWLAAGRNLGSGGFRLFGTIVLPLSLPGIVVGCQLVFAGAISDYVLPMLMGTTRFRMLAPAIYDEAITNFSWPRAATMSVLMVIVVAGILTVSNGVMRRLAPWTKTL